MIRRYATMPLRMHGRRQVQALVATMVLVSSTWSGCICAGSPGVLVGAGKDVRFVSERATLLVSAVDGIRRVELDGSGSRLIFPGHHAIEDVSSDFRIFVLSDSETNLLIGDASTGAMRRVPQLDKRASAAGLSPDGTRVAVSRHSDYDLPQSQWKESDAIFLVDVATLAVEEIPGQTNNWPTRIEWAADGSALWLSMAWEKPSQWLTLGDKRRQNGLTSPPADLRVDPRHPKKPCPQTLDTPKWESTVTITDGPGASPRVLARLEGRERGFHDYQADFSKAAMTPACRYVVFEHRSKVWVADAAGGKFGPLVDGDWLFFLPTEPSSFATPP